MCKIKYLQRDTTHKKKLKGNSSADIDNNSNESFTRGVQEHISASRRKNHWTWREDYWNDQVWETNWKQLKKREESLLEHWHNIKGTNTGIVGVAERRERKW